MQIINNEVLSYCIREAIKEELHQHLKSDPHQPVQEERLLSKQELAKELGVSLVTLTDWMKKDLPFLRLHKRVYFKRSEVIAIMQQANKKDG
jgi:hypothetical protein